MPGAAHGDGPTITDQAQTGIKREEVFFRRRKILLPMIHFENRHLSDPSKNNRDNMLNRLMPIVAIVAACVVAPFSAAKSEPLQSSSCLYKGEAYTEGAYLYPNKLLLLTCTTEAWRLLWKVVPISRLGDIRQGSGWPMKSAPELSDAEPRIQSPPESDGRKCFAVGGKRYCQ